MLKYYVLLKKALFVISLVLLIILAVMVFG